MNAIKLAILIGLATIGAALPAHAADFVGLYSVSGIVDDGAPDFTGVGTAFNCTNPTNGTVGVNVTVLRQDGNVASTLAFPVGPSETRTFVTKNMNSVVGDVNLATGAVRQGFAAISAESSKVFCSVLMLDAANLPPEFMTSLHMLRAGGGEE